jgi:hypothetical protein
MTKYLLLFGSYCLVFVGRPLWREDASVFFLCCWPSPAQSFLGPSPLALVTIFYCLRFETSIFVASYDSQGHSGGIRSRLHTGDICLPLRRIVLFAPVVGFWCFRHRTSEVPSHGQASNQFQNVIHFWFLCNIFVTVVHGIFETHLTTCSTQVFSFYRKENTLHLHEKCSRLVLLRSVISVYYWNHIKLNWLW